MNNTRFILINPSNPGNVGAVARAMYVMGFTDLVLVKPIIADVLQLPETIARASSAVKVLQQAKVVDDLSQAFSGVVHSCATAMTARDFGPEIATPRDYFAYISSAQFSKKFTEKAKLALVFGSEKYGMLNQDVYKCNICLQIPTNPDYGSLNLAAAVQLIAYELKLALDQANAKQILIKPNAQLDLADGKKIATLLQMWRQVMIKTGYMNEAQPKKLLPRLQQIVNRINLTNKEVNILSGIANKINRYDKDLSD